MLAWWAYFTHPARFTAVITPRKVYTNHFDLTAILCKNTTIVTNDIAEPRVFGL